MSAQDSRVTADTAGNDGAGAADDIRSFWDADAATYDNSPSHYPQRPQEQAAWAAALRRLLPAPSARVLDTGAGTGFLSLPLAAQGYQVTAADFAPAMLARLTAPLRPVTSPRQPRARPVRDRDRLAGSTRAAVPE